MNTQDVTVENPSELPVTSSVEEVAKDTATATETVPETVPGVVSVGAQLEWLEVVSGDQAGANVNISSDVDISVGSAYENDIVLRCKQTEVPVKLQVQRYKGARRVQLVEGQASISGIELAAGEWSKLAVDSVVTFGEVGFVINSRKQKAAGDAGTANAPPMETASKRTVAMTSMAAGIVLLGVVSLQGYWSADAGQIPVAPSLQEQFAELGFDNLVVGDDDLNGKVVQGRVKSRDDYQKVLKLVSEEYSTASLDIQIDVELVDRIEDIYRNHGATGNITVLGKGHVRVESEGVDEETIADIEKALRSDLPVLEKLEAVNTPLEPELTDQKVAAIDPDKEVEAIVAGDVSYVITRDQARYFVGSVLPSGHTITSISEGTVVMLLQGEETQLNF